LGDELGILFVPAIYRGSAPAVAAFRTRINLFIPDLVSGSRNCFRCSYILFLSKQTDNQTREESEYPKQQIKDPPPPANYKPP
jgi:hypothetical protein